MFLMIILSAGTFVGKLCSEMRDQVHFWKVIGQYGLQAIEKFIPFLVINSRKFSQEWYNNFVDKLYTQGFPM